jgi:3-oxoacyl-[acyl-carrier protein] reductase
MVTQASMALPGPGNLPWRLDAWSDQRVVVTGSGRGIGQGCARFFAQHRAKVLLVARSESELLETRQELRKYTPDVDFLALDLTDQDAPAMIVDRVVRNWAGLDIVVSNAGGAAQGGFLDLADEEWRQGFGLKMFANMRVIRETWPLLKESKGHVVMIGGGTGKTPERHLSLVSAINGGQAALSKSIAEQGILDGVHVNLVQPGIIQTRRRQRLFEKLAKQNGFATEEWIAQSIQQARVIRLGTPEDIAQLVGFLTSEASRWIQGAIIDADGGQTKAV